MTDLATLTTDWGHLPCCLGDVLGVSAAIDALRRETMAAAEDDAPVLISGEPGAGLSLVARTIHECSRRRRRPFVWLDCRLHSAESMDRELFGVASHAGSAANGCEGRLDRAAGGTLCLENVDALPQSARDRLARRWSRVCRSQASANGRAGGRLLATTHAPQTADDTASDLLASLCGESTRWVIAVPPLRERREDLALLAEHFLHRIAVREGRPAPKLTLEALGLLEAHLWPGNVRELECVIERACALADGPHLTEELVRPWLCGERQAGSARPGLSLKDMERKLIETTFARCRGNRERTAQTLGIGIRTLSGKLREYGYPPRGGPGSNRPARQPHAA